jgi:biopolymer transport protein ExbD
MQVLNPGSGGLQSEINVTPLVDVVLVLLIIFMVIVPLTLNSYEVAVPTESQAAVPADLPEPEQIVLAVDAELCPALDGCQVRLNDETLALSELPGRIREIFASRTTEDRVLFLAADDSLNYEAVMRIVDSAKAAAGELRIGIVTAERS